MQEFQNAWQELDSTNPITSVNVDGELEELSSLYYLEEMGKRGWISDDILLEAKQSNLNHGVDSYNFIMTLLYVMAKSQEQLSLYHRFINKVPSYYYITFKRSMSNIGLKATLDQILQYSSLRVWTLSIPQMSQYYKAKKMDKARQENEQIKVSGIECRECKSTSTIATTAQTRGGDEQETAYIKCIDCNANWVIN